MKYDPVQFAVIHLCRWKDHNYNMAPSRVLRSEYTANPFYLHLLSVNGLRGYTYYHIFMHVYNITTTAYSWHGHRSYFPRPLCALYPCGRSDKYYYNGDNTPVLLRNSEIKYTRRRNENHCTYYAFHGLQFMNKKMCVTKVHFKWDVWF